MKIEQYATWLYLFIFLLAVKLVTWHQSQVKRISCVKQTLQGLVQNECPLFHSL